MYEALFEMILCYIFVRKKRKLEYFKDFSLKWTSILVILNVQITGSFSSAFVLENSSPIVTKIESRQFPETTTYKRSENFSHLFLINNLSSINDVNSQQEQSIYIYRHSFFVSAIYIAAYSVVFVIGLVGNCVVIIVVIRSSRMRNATNFFICNLAFADTLVIVFCLPATLLGHLFTPWILGFVLCKLVSYLQGVAVSASINTLVAVSIERYLAICFPFKRPMGRRQARKWIIVIWTISLSIAMPWAFYFRTIPYNQSSLVNQSSVEVKTFETFETKSQQQLKNDISNQMEYELNDRIENQFSDLLDDEDHLKSEMSRKNTYQFSDQSVLDNGSNVKKYFEKRTIHSNSSPVEYCEAKRMAEISVLNDIHRFILERKLNLLSQRVRINRKNLNPTKNKMLELMVSYLQNSMTNSAFKNYTKNLSELNLLIKKLDLKTCKCFEVSELFIRKNWTIIDLQFSIQKAISVYLNLLFGNGSKGTKNNEAQSKQPNTLIGLMTKLSSDNKTLEQLNSLENSLYEQIESRAKHLPLYTYKCKIGCESEKRNCNLPYLFSDQLYDQKDFSKQFKVDNQPANPSNDQLDSHSYKLRLERAINEESKQSTMPNNVSPLENLDHNQNTHNYETCTEQWPNPYLEKTYFIVANLILCYLLPLVIISACYVAIYCTVWARSVPCETTSETAINATAFELSHYSCRENNARKRFDKEPPASSSKSTKSLLVSSFSGLKNCLLPAASQIKNSKNSNASNLNDRQRNMCRGRLFTKQEESTRNQNLIFKLEANQNDEKLNSVHKSTEHNPDFLSRTSDHYELVNEQLIKEDKECFNSLTESMKATNDYNHAKKSIIVGNLLHQNNCSDQYLNNAKQQIIVRIDPNSATLSANDSSNVHKSTSKVCGRFQNECKIFHKFRRRKNSPEISLTVDQKDSESISFTPNSQLKHRRSDSNGSEELMKSDQPNDLDYAIEQIEELEHNFKQNLNQASLKENLKKCSEPGEQTIRSLKDSIKCGNRSRNRGQIETIMNERVLPKQSTGGSYASCSTINNNCKSHHTKQLIKSTKSTPIIENDTLSAPANQAPKNCINSRHKLSGHLNTSTKLNNQIEVLIKNSRYKVAKMMVVIILVFFICWLPLYIIFTKLKLGLQFTQFTQLEEKITFLLAPIAQWICYINSCVNPLLYFFLNKKYRAEFKKLFSNVSCFRYMNGNKHAKNQKHYVSTTMKASVRSHPSINVKYERQFVDKIIVNETQDKNLERHSDRKCEENNKRTISESANNYQLRLKQYDSMRKDQQKKVPINRSLSDIKLENRTSVK